jgi:hypothetical protein
VRKKPATAMKKMCEITKITKINRITAQMFGDMKNIFKHTHTHTHTHTHMPRQYFAREYNKFQLITQKTLSFFSLIFREKFVICFGKENASFSGLFYYSVFKQLKMKFYANFIQQSKAGKSAFHASTYLNMVWVRIEVWCERVFNHHASTYLIEKYFFLKHIIFFLNTQAHRTHSKRRKENLVPFRLSNLALKT